MIDSGIVEDILLEKLNLAIHGSGFDSDWSLRQLKNGNMVGKIGYHAMDEPGYYDGWFDVNVTFDPRTFEIIRQTYTASRYHRRKYLYDTDYFSDTVHYGFQETAKSLTQMEPDCGEWVKNYAARLVCWADFLGKETTAKFNNILLTANPGDEPEKLVAYFWEKIGGTDSYPNEKSKHQKG